MTMLYRYLKSPIPEMETLLSKALSFYTQLRKKPEPVFDRELLEVFR